MSDALPDDLAQLRAEAEADATQKTTGADCERGGVPAGDAAPVPALSMLEEARALLTFGVSAVAKKWPALATLYTAAVIDELAGVIVPVMQKYNITFDTAWAKWAPEIKLLIVVVPLIGETLKVMKADAAAAPMPLPAPSNDQPAPQRNDGALRPNPA